jgi:hypothetical protein
MTDGHILTSLHQVPIPDLPQAQSSNPSTVGNMVASNDADNSNPPQPTSENGTKHL